MSKRNWRLAMMGALVAVFAGTFAQGQKLDLNTNGVSDVWEQIHGAAALDPKGDADGDGVSNLLESLAGTNPFDPNSLPKLSVQPAASNRVNISIAAALGKRYILQSSRLLPAPNPSNWVAESSVVARTGTVVTFSAIADGALKFFRVAISDVDTDGDGLNDWEEYQLGLDPMQPLSNQQLDANGQPLGDYAFAASRIASQNVVTIAASTRACTQPDPGPPGRDSGLFTITHAGFPLNSITVNLGLDGPGPGLATEALDYAPLPRTLALPAGVSSASVTLTPWANQALMTPLIARLKLLPGAGYSLGLASNASVLIYPNPTPHGTGLTGQYFTNASPTWSNSANFNPANLKLARQDPVVDFVWSFSTTAPITNNGYYSVRWTGQVQPEFSETYYFDINTDDGAVLWVNDRMITNRWSSGNAEAIGAIDLVAGARYNFKLEYFNTGGSAEAHLYWYSPSQPKQIIPAARLFPADAAPVPPAVTSPLSAIAFLGQPFSYTVTGANTPAGLTASFLPPGLGFTNSIIGGIPALAGNFQIMLASSNAAGISPSLLNLQVLETGSSVTREVWPGVAGTNVSDIPLGVPASTNFLPGLSGTTNYADNYGERIRGYITAPATGNYYFWIAASDSAELWISNDSEPVNKVRRAYVLPAGKGTAPQQWNLQPGQKSPWLSLIAGQRYYLEILHKAGEGTNDNWAVAWLQDPTGTNTLPAGVVPAYALSRYFQLPGIQTFAPPPSPPAWSDDHTNANAAARFLLQATYGPSAGEIAKVQTLGYAGWISNQFGLPVGYHLPNVLSNVSPNPYNLYPSTLAINTWWKQSVSASDQLRQRVAFALSEIMVVSVYGVLEEKSPAIASYYDTLLDNAFGNFRSLLKAVTLSPAMGLYLDMRGSLKADITRGTHPNENFAREVLQLFSVGENRRWPDGSLALDSAGSTIPTYDQDAIMGFASAFTGWNYYQTNQANGRLPASDPVALNFTNVMVLVPTHHDPASKRLLNNVVLPPAWGSQADPASTNFDSFCSNDLEAAIDSIFYDESVGPFICRQLIQRLVTSSPGAGYVYRVAQVFKDNGAGVRGDLRVVIKAILLDYEARSPAMADSPSFGKQREPLLRITALARAFPAPASIGGAYSQAGDEKITVTTTNAHRLAAGDSVFLNFSDTSGHAVPPAQTYLVTGASTPASFTVTAPGLAAGAYKQVANSLTVTCPNHGLSPGFRIFLVFTTGGASNGIYQVTSAPDVYSFTVATADNLGRNGNCFFPILRGLGFIQAGTNITVSTALAHELRTNDTVYFSFPANFGTNGNYRIVGVPDARHFVVNAPSFNTTLDGLTVCPLVLPNLTRSGTAVIQWSSWNVGATDTGDTSTLSQTPMGAPTVFNFFFPDFRFPGPLASANLTTPEFQLTSDTKVTQQMNFVTPGILGAAANTNGLSSYLDGNGAIMLDIGPWMTPAFTSNSGIPGLVDLLNPLLLAGRLSPAAKTAIVNYVANSANFPYTTPTSSEMRDRVRAIVHLIALSPDFAIQR